MRKLGPLSSVVFVWACNSGGSAPGGGARPDANVPPTPDASVNDATNESDAGVATIGREAIVFAAVLDGQTNADLYVFDGRITRLTESEGAELYPSISPDRTQIAFVRDFQLFIVDANGDNERRVAAKTGRIRNGQSFLGPAAWSPDGTQLAYPYPRDPFIVDQDGIMVDESGATTIHIVNADGSNDHVVPNLGGSVAASINSIGWGPAETLSFQLADDCPDCAGGSWFAVMKTDGTEYREFSFGDPATTGRIAPNKHLDWSADGSRWVYVAEGGYGTYEEPGFVFWSPAYVDDEHPVSPVTLSWSPRWSPDGTQIAFIAADGIYTSATAGGTPQRLLVIDEVHGLDW
jgi:hypothetical protein